MCKETIITDKKDKQYIYTPSQHPRQNLPIQNNLMPNAVLPSASEICDEAGEVIFLHLLLLLLFAKLIKQISI